MDRSIDEQRRRLEADWLAQVLTHSKNWRTFDRNHCEILHQKKQFVVWEVRNDHPKVVDVLQVGEIGVSWEDGITAILKSARTERQYTITSRPREEIPGVFLWIPAFAEIRHTPMKYEVPGSVRRLTVPMSVRTARAVPSEGVRYFFTLKDFVAMWPGIL